LWKFSVWAAAIALAAKIFFGGPLKKNPTKIWGASVHRYQIHCIYDNVFPVVERNIKSHGFNNFDWSMQDHTISRYDVLIGDEI
jgi:hypothetical protein